MEIYVICWKEIHDATIGRQVDIDHFLGFLRAYSWDLPGTWNNRHKSAACYDVLQRSWSLQSALKEGGECQGASSCCATMHVPIQRPHCGNPQAIEVGSHEHSPHSPDLVLSNFHLLGPLKEALGGRRFRSNEDVKKAIHQWLPAQPKTFYYNCIKKLVWRWEKYVEKQGDYIEK
jgi:hypothetical protein